MSLTYMRNSKGPRMDPCGTLYVILEGSKITISKFTLYNRFKPTNSINLRNQWLSIFSIVYHGQAYQMSFGGQSVSCQSPR